MAAAGALLLAGGLAGCAADPTSPTTSSAAPATPAAAQSSTPTSTSASTAAPLSCDDLIPKTQIVQALAAGQSADDWVVLPVSTADGSLTGTKAVQGAGGLTCSWRAGPPASETGTAVLSVAVLPDAAEAWTGQLYGDGPTSDRRTFAGISAAASCGDPGCGASAAVGSSWVRVDLITGSREGGRTAFAEETDDEVFAGLKPAVESAFRTVQDASAGQLRFPDHLPADGKAGDCYQYLKDADIVGALAVKDYKVSTDYQLDPEEYSIDGAAAQRIGTSVCTIEDPQYSYLPEVASVTVAPEQSWTVADFAAHPEQRGDLHVVDLKGAAKGEHALTDCSASGHPCRVLFSVGSTAIEVENTDRAVQLAEAIVTAAG